METVKTVAGIATSCGMSIADGATSDENGGAVAVKGCATALLSSTIESDAAGKAFDIGVELVDHTADAAAGEMTKDPNAVDVIREAASVIGIVDPSGLISALRLLRILSATMLKAQNGSLMMQPMILGRRPSVQVKVKRVHAKKEA